MAGSGKVIFRDKTRLWVPLVTVLILIAVFWGGMVWETNDLDLTNIVSLILLVVLLLALPLQGRLFWTHDIATLTIVEGGLEARTEQWIGWGRRLRFTAAEASWKAVVEQRPKLILTLNTQDYTLDLKSAQVVDRHELGRLAPQAMAAIAHPPPTPVAG